MREMNLIVICLDTFRADMVGPGHKLSFVDTPNLDGLARESVVFDRAFGEGQPTLQIRRAFFTGCRSFPWRYNFDRRGHWHHAPGWHKIPPHQDTLAEILLSQGYFTGLVADTYHMFKPTMNFWRGFTTYEFIRGQETDNWRGGTPAMIEDQVRRHAREPSDWPRLAGLVQYLYNMRGRHEEEDYLCARVFRTAARWLEDNAANAPFFLWVDSFDPHEPWDPPRAYADRYFRYDGIDFIYPNNVDATPEEQERTRALYFGEVTLVDKWVGYLLDKIDQLKLWDDTIVMVTCDHGTQLQDHGRFGKGPDEMHPFNTQLMWLVRCPDGPHDQHIDGFVQSHDLMPTVLALLNVPHPGVDGINVWPLVTGARDSVRDHVVTGWAVFGSGNAGARASVRDAQWNYITTVHQEDPAPELYHLPSDPEEQVNLHEQHPEIVARQRARLETVVGQPIPAQLNEVCDHPVPAPMHRFLRARYGR